VGTRPERENSICLCLFDIFPSKLVWHFYGLCRHFAGKMTFSPDHSVLLNRLEDAVRFAAMPRADLFSKIIAGVCTRIAMLERAGRATPIGRWLETQAWTEAALALVQFELPGWQVRRLVRDGAEWMCSLSRQPHLPAGLDDSVDAMHESLPFAILLAFLEARRRTAKLPPVRATVPAVAPVAEAPVCCDNFR